MMSSHSEALRQLTQTALSCYSKDDIEYSLIQIQSNILKRVVTDLESRKANLVIGSRWECLCKSYGTVKIIDVHPLSENVTFVDTVFSRTERIDDFICCFKPIKEEK